MEDLIARLEAALADRYHIERELGRGGMATVYLAYDLKHHRRVAVKVLKPGLAAAIGPERFLREIEITGQLNHPHILPLLDSGEAEGLLFYVMPYVEGESLADRLDREKQLPLEDALRITAEVADALGFAHSRNVLHRDIKPENILFEGGHAVVADFGLARAITAAGSERLTETGIAVGTPEYMSPEQVSAEREIDGRSDLYSLACVVYEMLAGEPPFTGPTTESVARQHLTAEPRSVATLRTAVPEEVSQALMKALAKAPADRFLTAEQFMEAVATPSTTPSAEPKTVERRLRGVLVGALAVVAVVVATAIVLWLRSTPAAPPGAERPRIAVLPFENLGSPEDEYFADGITEEITSRLVDVSGLHVVSRTSTVGYKNHGKPLRQVGEELKVDYVLEGTIRTDRSPEGGGEVRVTPQLVRVSDDAHLWAGRYTVALVPGEIFEVQARIAGQVAGALDVTLLEPERQRVEARPTDNATAYEYYIRHRAPGAGTWEGSQRRMALLDSAIMHDPNFALAYARRSDLRMAQIQLYGESRDRLPEVKQAYERALQLDPDLLAAHFARARYVYQGLGDLDRALELFQELERRQPNDARTIAFIGYIKRRQAKWDEAIGYLERAADLDPVSSERAFYLGNTYVYVRRYELAERYYDRAIALRPMDRRSYARKVRLYLLWDAQLEKARGALRELVNRFGPGEAASELAATSQFAGATAAARILADEYREILRDLSFQRWDTQFRYLYYPTIAQMHEMQGQSELARTYWDSSRVEFAALVESDSDSPVYHRGLSLAYAGLGLAADAISEAETAANLVPPLSADALARLRYLANLAEVQTQGGARDAAIAQLEQLLSIPSWISRSWLQVDPLYDPLRDHPRFQALLAGES